MSGLVINVFPARTAGAALLMVGVPETPFPSQGTPADALELLLQYDKDPFASLMKLPAPHRVVYQCGDALYASLDQVPRFKQTSLDPAVRTAIYFKLESPLSENLPWEALWHQSQQRFIALERNWPIARLAPTSHQDERDSCVEPELTILLVLAAARGDGPAPVDAGGEWNEIFKALSASPAAGKLRVHVLTCQDEILQSIEALQNPSIRITCEPMASARTFHQAVSDLSPNIVHFFCHGSAEEAEPLLNIATLGDYDAELAEGSISLGMSELSALTGTESLWLVTLNCCQGARASGRVSSLAAKLAGQGVPTVVAMRESVDFRKANQFAGEYYKHLIASLAAVLPDEQAAQQGILFQIPESVWVDAMHESRAMLANPARDQDPAWTLPVVYVRRGPLKLKARPRSASVMTLLPPAEQTKITRPRAQAATLRTLMAQTRGPDTPVALLRVCEEQVVAFEREADRAERDALLVYVKNNGLSELQSSMARQRLDDLDKRVG
jgi:hypothetical protein